MLLAVTTRYVFHAHSPTIWRRAAALRIPTTDPGVAYGTPQMAREVERLWRSTSLPDLGILSMGGHEDGIVAFGRSAEQAGEIALRYLAHAYEAACAEDYTLILGLTPTGRATVEKLDLNRSGVVNLRRLLLTVGLYPPGS